MAPLPLDIIIPVVTEKRASARTRANQMRSTAETSLLHVRYARSAAEVVRFAARELAAGLSAMLTEGVRVETEDGLDPHALAIEGGADAPAFRRRAVAGRAYTTHAAGAAAACADCFSVERGLASGAVGFGRETALLIRGTSARAVLHGVYDLLERLGARFALGKAPELPHLERARLAVLAPYSVTPAFSRRAFASDIMTWHYADAERLRMHLEHDREFISWMGWRGTNAFEYISHAGDTLLKIDDVDPMLTARGIRSEYGGHVLPRLLPRELFLRHPEFFPCRDDGRRSESGNLCVSSRAALDVVCQRAVDYVRENPAITVLHVWGADVRSGGWCRCAGCAGLSPQAQYMTVVNEIAAAIACDRRPSLTVAYLAYHDTLEPDSVLRPLENVWFEWAPRERCYSHAIDDIDCEVNPRYLESLKRYIDLFDGRGSVFEYYADAILFGGIATAMPSTICRDLAAYHRMSLRSISCLTFGAFSALAYPINLETFARATRSLDFDPDAAANDVGAQRYLVCGPAMARAYRAVARASALALTYGDLFRPPARGADSIHTRERLVAAAAAMRSGVAAAEVIAADAEREGNAGLSSIGAERDLWKYSAETLEGLAQWLEASTLTGAERECAGARAIEKIDRAIRHVYEISAALKGTWGTYDLERSREIWLEGLKRRLSEQD